MTRIVDAALELVDRDGLAELSMRKLGAALGVEAMSLYKHVSDKEQVLDLLVERVYSLMELPDQSDMWADRLRLSAHELRRVAIAHPHLLIRAVTNPPNSIIVSSRVNAFMDALRDGCGDDAAAVRAFWMLTAYLSGSILSEVSARRVAKEVTGRSVDQAETEFAIACPALVAVAEGLATCDFAEEFSHGFETILSALGR